MKEAHVVLRTLAKSRIAQAGAETFDLRNLESAEPGVLDAGLSVDVDEIDRGRVQELRQEEGVLGVAPAIPMSLIAPLDVAATAALAGAAWGVKAVRADTSKLSGAGVVIAVLDTGIAKEHPAFADVAIAEKDFTGDGDGDVNGHGTHCAGTIFGRDVDGMRIGVARGVTTVLIGKVIGKKGGSSPQIVNAIQWAVQNGANVISMSLGIDFPGYQAVLQQQGYPPQLATSLALEGYRANVELFESLAQFLKKLGPFSTPTLLVAAAGNESHTDQDPRFKIAVSPPALADGFISVAALAQGAQGLTVAPFSNTGATLAGPGVAIVSANFKGGVAAMSGTSMATPHVAGVAALLAERLKSRALFSTARWTSDLTSSAVTTGLKDGFDAADIGFGLVQAPQS